MKPNFRFKQIDSNWVAIHPNPKGVIQFLGGAVFGTKSITLFPLLEGAFFDTLPITFYRHLLENLFLSGYTVVVFPYWLTINHWNTAKQLFEGQQKLPTLLVKEAEKQGLSSKIYQDSKNYFLAGHSLGCKYITLLHFLSLKKQEQILQVTGGSKRFNSDQSEDFRNRQSNVSLEIQPALMIAPCFDPPDFIKSYVTPTQSVTRRLLANLLPVTSIAMISFNNDCTSGNLANKIGDVYWIYERLKQKEGKGLAIYQEIQGNHLQPLDYKSDKCELVNLAAHFLEGLRKHQSVG